MASHHEGTSSLSQYIDNLNATSDMDEVGSADSLSLDEQIAMFTFTHFFDYNHAENSNLQPVCFEGNVRPAHLSIDTLYHQLIGDNVETPQDLAFLDEPFLSELPFSTPSPTACSTSGPGIAPFVATAEDLADDSRLAAEQDKRFRNTAASARFRVKKKQREQALEKSAKELSSKVGTLQNRITELETENKWLMDLVVNKNESQDPIIELWKKHSLETVESRTSDGDSTLAKESSK